MGIAVSISPLIQDKKYYSCNNLTGTTSVNRQYPSGETPAYTVEVISRGTYKGTTRYLRVILVRDDVLPYPVSSDGKIVLGAMTEIDIEGKGEGDPGHIHSNWVDGDIPEGEDPENSILSEETTTLIKSNSGIASATGFVDLPDTFDGYIKEEAMSKKTLCHRY